MLTLLSSPSTGLTEPGALLTMLVVIASIASAIYMRTRVTYLGPLLKLLEDEFELKKRLSDGVYVGTLAGHGVGVDVQTATDEVGTLFLARLVIHIEGLEHGAPLGASTRVPLDTTKLMYAAPLEPYVLSAATPELTRRLQQLTFWTGTYPTAGGLRIEMRVGQREGALEFERVRLAVVTCVRAARTLLEHWPATEDLPRRLAERARAEATSTPTRQQAARHLVTSYASSAEALALAADLDGLPLDVQAECYAVGVGPAIDLSDEARRVALNRVAMESREPESRASSALRERYAWATLHDPEVSPELRRLGATRACGDALAPEPGPERDRALTALFTSEAPPANPFELYAALSEGGWRPSAGARIELLDQTQDQLMELMLRHLQKRELDDEDVTLLRELVRRGADMRAMSLLRSAGAELPEGGQLTIAEDDSSRGGLTAAAPQGGLEEV